MTSYNFDESLARSGNLDPISMIYPDGRKVEYHYDNINRLNQINDTGHSAIVAYDYIDRTPIVLQKTYQNGTLRTMQYDGIRRPTLLTTDDSSMNTIIGFEHAYDAEDNKLNERKVHDPTNSELYSYDSAYRLMNFDRGILNAGGTAITTPTATAGVLQLRDWTLDGVGNWASNDAQSVGGSLLTANRNHTNFNEIASEEGTSLGYGHNGNQINDGTYLFSWDALNRLRTVTRISDSLQVAAYTYDCQNRRMQKEVTNSGSLNGTTDFYYSGWRICEEYDFDGTNETLKYQYVWGATYHDEIIVRDDRSTASITQLNDGTGSDRQFQHTNSLFSIFAVTDEAGNVLERFQYDPYGNQTIMDASFTVLTSSAIDQEFSYTGQRFDSETDLYYYKNRYYSSEQGRFISRDPIGYFIIPDNIEIYPESENPFSISRKETELIHSVTRSISRSLIIHTKSMDTVDSIIERKLISLGHLKLVNKIRKLNGLTLILNDSFYEIQHLNLFTYTNGSPLNSTDPLGTLIHRNPGTYAVCLSRCRCIPPVSYQLLCMAACWAAY